MKMIKTLKSLPMAVAAVAVLAAAPAPGFTGVGAAVAAQEQQKQQETRKVPAMSIKIHKMVQKAQEAMDLKDLVAAKELLADALQSKGINDYERAVVWQLTASIAFEEDDPRGAIRAFEQMLVYRNSIPVALELGIMYNLGQLYASENDYDNALRYLQEWEPRAGEFVGVNQLVFIAIVHYNREDYPNSLVYVDRAIAMAETLPELEIKENWYQIKLSSHYELGQFSDVRDVLELLLVHWPKPDYWTQLASVYSELGDEESFYSLLEAAYRQGFLDDSEPQLVNVAQIQISRDAPIKCAWVLKRALDNKLVEKSARNMLTLGQCYMRAQEYQKAVEPLSFAATRDDDPELWFQIGQVEMANDDLKGAVEAFEKTIDGLESSKKSKDKELRFSAMMLRAQMLIELKRFKDARTAFSTASRIADQSKQKRQLKQWRDYLRAEEEREKMLTGD